MELWLNLLFGNAVGLMSMIVIFVTIGICSYFAWFIITKSRGAESTRNDTDGHTSST